MNVVALSKAECEEWVKAKHYSRRASIFWAGFGLEIDGMIEGVCVYGQPSPPIQKHAFRDRDFQLYELARLVIQTPAKNAASFLVGNSLQLLKGPCAVVSYADTEQGHSGIVYQATNWTYTGATKSHDKAYMVDGKRTHPMTLRGRGITDPVRWAKENGIQMVPPMEKHRYFQFVGDRRQRRMMLGKLAYPVVNAYPKSPRSRYDDGESIIMALSSTSKNNSNFVIDSSPPKSDTKASPQQRTPTLTTNTMFEQLIAVLTSLVAAIEANTAARSTEAPAANTAAPVKRRKKAETPVADDTPEPEPAKKKSPEITHEDIREVVKNARDQLRTSVSAEAAALHKVKTAEVLKKFKAESITKIADKDLEEAFDLISAIDCTTAAPDDDEDDL